MIGLLSVKSTSHPMRPGGTPTTFFGQSIFLKSSVSSSSISVKDYQCPAPGRRLVRSKLQCRTASPTASDKAKGQTWESKSLAHVFISQPAPSCLTGVDPPFQLLTLPYSTLPGPHYPFWLASQLILQRKRQRRPRLLGPRCQQFHYRAITVRATDDTSRLDSLSTTLRHSTREN